MWFQASDILTVGLLAGGALALDRDALYRAAGLYTCPELCTDAGANPYNWTLFHSNDDLKWCKDKTMVLNLPMHLSLADPSVHSVFRACVSSASEDEVKANLHEARKRAETNEDGAVQEISQIKVIQSSAKSSLANYTADVSTAIRQLQSKYLSIPASDNTSTPFFAKRGDVVVGAFVGGMVQKQGAAASLLERLAEMVAAAGQDSLAQTTVLQLCEDARNSDYTAGVVVDGRGGLDSVFAVQDFVRTWSMSQCVKSVEGTTKTEAMSITYTDDTLLPSKMNGTLSNSTDGTAFSKRYHAGLQQLDPRADCRTVTVIGGDGCGSLATKCGISANDFTKLHSSDKNFCSSLKEGQRVCCTTGSLPDIRPKPGSDGACAAYTTIGGDYCDKIAVSNGLTKDDLEEFNKNTWGWSGCKSLWEGMSMCLSKGDPPMPASMANAKCGPQVPGTKRPTNGTALADLNPCPLNVCCNIWGNCGTTSDFCTESSLGPPGTSEPGKNGCISSCGMDIVNNDEGPASTITLGYFEAWNNERECLHMDVTQMSKRISHIHFAFGDVTPSFTVSVAAVKEQFEKFKTMTGHHKVLAFGGWKASTHPTSYWIFREGVKDANREILATNLANFIIANDLDGIDMDWEYPGAHDLPDIPSADIEDGQRYLQLLKSLRAKLPADKTMSIAAPASFWYLQNYPIAEMSKVLDYIVYMTYDLHGQWDYDSKWSMPGCSGTSCLRSHVNMTETINALAMITKAGVKSNKIVVGVSSYGRAFQMTEAGCVGPQCGFVGPASGAHKGRCTQEAGYISNAEIDEIIKSGGSGGKRDGAVQMFTDDSESQILVYDSTHWVSYMDDNNKNARAAKWSGLKMAGTTDWAVDLATFTPGDDNKECWLSKNCMDSAVKDTDQNSAWRWYTLCADSAWSQAVDAWKKKRDSTSQSFPRAVSNFFHGPSAFDCNVMSTQNSCTHLEECIQGQETGPASWLILDSWAAIHEMIANMYKGVESAHNTLQTNSVLSDFVKTFCPDKKPDLALKIILDIVSFGLSFATGPIFNSWMRNTNWWKGVPASNIPDHKDLGDNLKDGSRSIITFSFTAAKDALPGPEPGKEGDTSKQILSIVRRFKENLNNTLPTLFSGKDESIDTLWSLINDGKLLTAVPVSDLNMEDKLLKIMYALLIPVMWRQKGWRPVLMDLEADCGKKVDRIHIIPEKDDSFVCFENRQYLLVRPEGKAFQRQSASAEHWGLMSHWNKAEHMAGFKTLDGKGWAGLKKEDIVASIINRRKNGGKNPGEDGILPDLGNKDVVNDMYQYIENDNIVQSPGYINIPVCNADEIKDNWQNKKDQWFSWPCNKP